LEKIADYPRKAYRNFRKAAGQPASTDVGIISKQLSATVNALESEVDFRVTEAAVSIPHLVALYMDDIEDACDYAGLENIELPHYWQPLIWESSSSFAGYRIGLCEHYENITHCREEEQKMRKWNAFIVHYSQQALITSLNPMAYPYGNFEPEYRHAENFSLGHDMLDTVSDVETYWGAVHRELRVIIDDPDLSFGEPDIVVVTGDKAHDKEFLSVLRTAVMMDNPIVYGNDTVFAIAKGTAELVMRGRYMDLLESNANSLRKDEQWVGDL
jgi:hypothetical protein